LDNAQENQERVKGSSFALSSISFYVSQHQYPKDKPQKVTYWGLY